MKVMRLPTAEFIRRFLIHVLPSGLHASAMRASSPTASVVTGSR